MNEKNFEYLRDQVKYTGFGDGLEEELKEKMQQQKPGFVIDHEAYYGDDVARVSLNFKKSEQNDMYFFNSYKIDFLKENAKESLEQTFYINKGSNITMKEAYNLLEGRAVNKELSNKEGQRYNAWVQMDFKETDTSGNFKLNHYHQNYGYDLENTLSRHPIKELENPKFKEDLIDSIKKGNLQSVTFLKDGKEIKYFVEANPQFKTINVYDGNRQRINNRQSKDEKQSEGQNKTIKDSKKQSQSTAGDGEAVPQEKKSRRRQSNSM
ncbi:hypothetical protein [Flavobacterium sp. ZS1P14]|uniref:hypothetical protein n=1 Tax=Flavobacterium sp. ZS1P14 TaxID=3401729 RepID=UPI003AAAA2FC